ncbi:MAG: lipid II:glycine glycyltransferase FemX [Patescibacteria group bacterium]
MIREITDRSEWDHFFTAAGSPSFLQAWEWGTLNAHNSKYDIRHLGLYDKKEELISIAQVLEIRARRGNFLFIPHGPIFLENSRVEECLKEYKEYLVPYAKEKGFSFIRMSPIEQYSDTLNDVYTTMGWKTAPTYMHAERIWTLPLDKSEEELLADMRKTTRYLIRRAAKDGVKVEKRSSQESIEAFWKLYTQTASRESFTPFSKTFVDKEFQVFHESGNADYFFGSLDDRILAGALIVYTKSTAFYHQGASIHTKAPVPYALQWEAIKEAKRRGCRYYNFWGILQEGRTPKAWSGLTLFKKGFGGKQIDYIPTKDYVINPVLYLFSSIYERYLQWRRGV